MTEPTGEVTGSSSLRLDTLSLPTAPLGPVNPLPPLIGTDDGHARVDVSQADAQTRANMAYGHLDSLLPYTMQDGYTRRRQRIEHTVAVLENEVLRATFLLDYGGRLWSLVHRPSGRELLHRNQVLQPANLGLRNAWFAGGIEWNLGTTGHTPLTCEPVHAVRVTGTDGTPVLRCYEFERARQLVYAVDAWLPGGSPVLLVAIRMVNPSDVTVPAYWWSNVAVPESGGVRVVVPAERAYHLGPGRRLRVVDIPRHDGNDVSYPAGARQPGEWFFDCGQNQYPWIAAVDEDGQGLVQVSTSRLIGRKLFVWGRSPGGRRWQQFLSGPHQRYLEIQAGLARTQLEHLPLPAGQRWAWVEAYGLVRADPALVHGHWDAARAEIDRVLGGLVPSGGLDAALAEADHRAEIPPAEVLHAGSGWGALEEARRAHLGEPSLGLAGTPFATETLGPQQQPWLRLLRTGVLEHADPAEPPASYVVGPGWAQLVENAADDWASWLHRGIVRWHAGDRTGARLAAERSLACRENPWAHHILAAAALLEGAPERAAGHLSQAHAMVPGLRPLTVELLDALLLASQPTTALALVDGLGPVDRRHGRIRLLELRAAIAAGRLDRAKGILLDEDLVVDDLHEGEDSLHSLWAAYHEALAEAAAGTPLDADQRARLHAEHPLPDRLDFRMEW